MTKDPPGKSGTIRTQVGRYRRTHSILFHLGSLTHHSTGNQHRHCVRRQQHNHPPQSRSPHCMRLLRTRSPHHRLRRSININNISPKNSNTPNIHTPHSAAVSPCSPSHPVSVVVLPNPTVTPRSRLLMAATVSGFRYRHRDWLGWAGWVVRTLGPQESGLTFDHILSRCRVSCRGVSRRMQKLHNLTGVMNDIHGTPSGSLVCAFSIVYHLTY